MCAVGIWQCKEINKFEIWFSDDHKISPFLRLSWAFMFMILNLNEILKNVGFLKNKLKTKPNIHVDISSFPTDGYRS